MKEPRLARPRLAALISIMMLFVFVGGCDASGSGSSAERLPPSTQAALTRLFGHAVEKYGVRISRAALEDPTKPSYGPDPDGTHLAIYLKPTGPMTPQEYADRVIPTAQIFLPKVFRRWKGLKSFDLCLEPAPGVDDRTEPPPVTKVYVERSGSDAVSWSTVTLTELRGVQRHDLALYLSDAVQAVVR